MKKIKKPCKHEWRQKFTGSRNYENDMFGRPIGYVYSGLLDDGYYCIKCLIQKRKEMGN